MGFQLKKRLYEKVRGKTEISLVNNYMKKLYQEVRSTEAVLGP